MANRVEPYAFYHFGLEIMHRDPIHQEVCESSLRRFRSFFGVDPDVCTCVYTKTFRFMQGKKGFIPQHLLWGLMLMKLYATEGVLASFAGVTEKTFRKRAWDYIHAIGMLKYEVILWQNRFRQANGSACNVTVDGTDFRIQEPRPFWNGWFSHKTNGPALRYEVCICIQTGDIVWIHGPFPAGEWSDIKIFRLLLKSSLVENERVEADQGYKGERMHIDLPHECLDQSGSQEMLKTLVRSRHESINRRFKQFNILSSPFRHKLDLHQMVFYAVAVITQINMEECGNGPFQIEGYHTLDEFNAF